MGLGGPHNRSGRFGEEKFLFSLSGIELWIVQPVPQPLTAYCSTTCLHYIKYSQKSVYKKPEQLLHWNGVEGTGSDLMHFMFCWPYISIHLCNINQPDALFIPSSFRQSTSTCFGHIFSPSSGGILHIYNNWHVLSWKEGCLKIQYISWRWATNMPETCRGWMTK